jgi:prepilin-type N-terminal cleavage/methylation domain-containing protein
MTKIINYKLKIKNLSPDEGGFTLIEVLVASAILVILASGFLGLQYIIGQNQVSVWRNYLSIEAANTAISSLTRELRDARQSDTGNYLLEIANDNEIVFYSDIDFDDKVERVHYTLTANVLTKGIIEPTNPPVSYPADQEKTKIVTDIARNLSVPLFSYYNSDWPGDTTNNPLSLASRISDTTQVKIYLRTNPVDVDAENDYILEGDVRLRMIF